MKIVRDITNLVCMLVYQMGIQIYDQISIPKNCSQVKLCCTVSLALTLNEVKITWNIVKVGVHTYQPNAHQKIWWNFYSDKFVKSGTPSCSFAKVRVKGGENTRNVLEFAVHARLSNGNPNLWSNFNCEKILKSETPSCIFARVRLKAGLNSSKHFAKFGVHACISNGHPNLWSNFNSRNLVKSETPSCGFAKVWIKGGKKSSEHH